MSEPYFLYAGRLEPVKGVTSLVGAFRGRSERLVVAGDGSQIRRLRRAARPRTWSSPAGCPSTSSTAGTAAPSRWWCRPSATESFGLVAVEAFARGTPVLVHPPGALADLVEDTGRGAVLWHPRAELNAALDRLVAEPQLREELGRRGRAAYEARFTPDAHLRGYSALIAEVDSTIPAGATA